VSELADRSDNSKSIIQPSTYSERFVHHMMLYECHDDPSTADSHSRFHHHVNSGYECNTPNMPHDFKRCRGIVAAWGIGGDAFHFPDEAGYPVGEKHGGATYYMFEVSVSDNMAQMNQRETVFSSRCIMTILPCMATSWTPAVWNSS